MKRNKIKRLDEFVSAPAPTTRPGRPGTSPTPTTRPGTPRTTPRPGLPVPGRRPSEREKGKPIATVDELLDMFFEVLSEEKGTKQGKKMIKKLHDKYAKKDK
jgi:hypothetical protein